MTEVVVNRTDLKRELRTVDSFITQEIIQILNRCSDILKTENIGVEFLSALIIKTVFNFGCNNLTIEQLRMEHYQEQLNRLVINGDSFILQDNLAFPFKKLYQFRKTMNVACESEPLFSLDGKSPVCNELKYSVLNKELKAFDLAECKICQLIYCGVSKEGILSLTGFSEVVYSSCANIVKEKIACGNLQGSLRMTEYDTSI